MAPFILQITRQADQIYDLRIPPSNNQLRVLGNWITICTLLAQDFSLLSAYTPHAQIQAGHNPLHLVANPPTQIRDIGIGGTLELMDINTKTAVFEFNSLLRRSHALPTASSTVIPTSTTNSDSIMERFPTAFRHKIYAHILHDFMNQDPELRKAERSRTIRHIIITNPNSSTENLAITEHPMLSLLLGFPALEKDANTYFFKRVFFDFQKEKNAPGDSFDTTNLAINFFAGTRYKYLQFVSKIRVCMSSAQLENEPDAIVRFVEWLASAGSSKKITDLPWRILKRPAARLDYNEQKIKVPQYAIEGIHGQELAIILAPSNEEVIQIATLSKAKQRRTIEAAITSGMERLSRVLVDPYYNLRATQNLGLDTLPLEIRSFVWDRVIRDIPSRYLVRKPRHLFYSSGHIQYLAINRVHHALRAFCVNTQYREELMYRFVQRTTFVLSTRGESWVIDDFFDRLGPAHISKLKRVEIATNLTWDGIHWHERLREVVLSAIKHCAWDDKEDIDPAKYFVDRADFSPPKFKQQKPEWNYGPDYHWHIRPAFAAHELFTLPLHGFRDNLTIYIAVAVPFAIFPQVEFSPYRKFDDLVVTINGALAGNAQNFVGTAFEWKVLDSYESIAVPQDRVRDWRDNVRPRLNR